MKHCNLWGRCLCRDAGSRCKEQDAHLWLEFIHTADSFINVTSFNRIADKHALFDGLEVDADVDSCFLCEFGGGIAVAFDDEVVKNDAV